MGKPIAWAIPLALTFALAFLVLLMPTPMAGAMTDLAVAIQDIQPYGDDEVVTIVNTGSAAVDLSGWRLESSNSRGQEVQETFWFPKGCFLPAGGVLRVHSGPYTRGWGEERCGYPQIDLAWTVAKIWSDRGDVAWLRDAAGNLVDIYTYGARPQPTTPPASPARPERPRAGGRTTTSTSEGCWVPTERCGRPSAWARAYLGCCVIEVYLEAIELVYDHGLGCNWSFSAAVTTAAAATTAADPPITPTHEGLPRLLYRDVIPGEAVLVLTAAAVEHDLWPDRGYARQELRLRCPCYKTIKRIVLPVRVAENECSGTGTGTGYGCETLWNFVFRVELEPFRPVAVPPAITTFEITPTGPYHVGDEVRLSVVVPLPGWHYEWDFDGDGVPDAAGPEVRYRLHSGTNLITLIATDPQGHRSTLTRGLRVVERRAMPVKAKAKAEWCTWLWVALPLAAIGGIILFLA